MICVRINRVHMIVVVMVMMPMVVIVVMMMVVMIVPHVQTAHARTEMIAFGTIRHIGPRRICTLTFNMMVVAFLHCTDLS